MAGTVPGSVPSLVYWRNETGETLASAQPPATLSRLALARFVFIGEDPLAGTPRVTIERESEPGVFEPLRRRSGRVVTDEDVLLLHTPDPLVRMGTNPRTHYWVVEWQAVPPTGDAALPAVADRTGLPLGRYRIHVEGTGYSVDSDAFEVVPATLTGSASRAGTTLSLSGLGYPEVAKGWRMIDRRTRPGQAAPLRGGTVRVQLRAGGMPLGAEQVATVSDGNASLTAGEVATADSALVTDRFGNTVTLTL
jgi:hypothetical protein